MSDAPVCPVHLCNDCRNCVHHNQCAREETLPRGGFWHMLLAEIRALFRRGPKGAKPTDRDR